MMQVLYWIVLGIGGLFGIVLVAGTVLGMIGVVIWKIYRKIRYGISLYE